MRYTADSAAYDVFLEGVPFGIVERNSLQNGKRRSGHEATPPDRQANALLALDVHAVEGVAPEGRELEVDDFLADRLQLHRMRDGEPGTLLLEDHLSLLVELG